MSTGCASAIVPAADRVSPALAFAVRRQGVPIGRPRPGLLTWQMQRVLAHIDARLDAPLRAPELAALAGLSPSHFSRRFKISFGLPPRKYVLRGRVDRAKRLIVANHAMPLAEIALLCGLADQAHLSRVFRRIAAETPGGWRRNHRAAAMASAHPNNS